MTQWTPNRAPPDFSRFRLLGNMEDVADRIVAAAGLHLHIPVYLDTFNPHWCT